MKTVKIQLKIVRETTMGYLVTEVDEHGRYCSDTNQWLPKSQVAVDTVILEMPKWMARERGFQGAE